jgi:hypothetical protein
MFESGPAAVNHAVMESKSRMPERPSPLLKDTALSFRSERSF